jgi:NhaA family Na+:H+ antiporter
MLLLGAAAVALAWTNSPWKASYERVWGSTALVAFHENMSLRFVINDGLMVAFFFVVGLEIRSEIHDGNLSTAKRAALPVALAVGGMVVPALIFLALNPTMPRRAGWGVPMATDIAFAVGVLALIGRRVSASVRVLLLALAIIDDIGAVAIICVFYSQTVSWVGLGLAAGGVALVASLQRFRVRPRTAYVLPCALVWIGLLRAGIHPAITGVVLGLLARPQGKAPVDEREGRTSADALGAALRPWVAFGVLPVFALANAGVGIAHASLGEGASVLVFGGVVLGLCVGKPSGIVAASFIATRLGVAELPPGVTWGSLALVGCLAGIGFTMAIFTASLAFPNREFLDAAKLGVVVASAAAAVAGLVLGRVMFGSPDTAT